MHSTMILLRVSDLRFWMLSLYIELTCHLAKPIRLWPFRSRVSTGRLSRRSCDLPRESFHWFKYCLVALIMTSSRQSNGQGCQWASIDVDKESSHWRLHRRLQKCRMHWNPQFLVKKTKKIRIVLVECTHTSKEKIWYHMIISHEIIWYQYFVPGSNRRPQASTALMHLLSLRDNHLHQRSGCCDEGRENWKII